MREIIEKNLEIEILLTKSNRTLKDLFCRECNVCLITEYQVKNLVMYRNRYTKEPTTPKYKKDKHSMYVIEPKQFGYIDLYRHTCWDCYIKNGGEPKIHIGVTKPDYHLVFDIGKEDILKVTHEKYNTASKESWIKRHGEDVAEDLFKKYCERQAYTASTEYFVNEKGMTEDQAKEYHLSRAVTEENLVKRWGETIGLEKWKAYCDRQAYAGCKLEYFIEKYGEELGTEKYTTMVDQKSKNGILRDSMISMELFDSICVYYNNILSDRSFNYSDTEILISDSKLYWYYPDFIDTKSKHIIEFFGTYWHADPKKYKDAAVTLFNRKTVGDIWNRDNLRIANLTKLGYKVLVIWEREYRKNKNDIFNRCIDFLNS